MTGNSDRKAFIQSSTSILPVPLTPEIRLHLADDETPLWRMSEEDLAELGLPSPFWAFAWSGGQALARYCLDHPDIIRGKRVFDFASGSGLVAIAACLAGACEVTACDIDPLATEAIGLNSALNGNAPERLTATDRNILEAAEMEILLQDPPDVFLAGDVFYDQAMSKDVLALLDALSQRDCLILIGDPKRSYFPDASLEELASYSIPRTRALEDADIQDTRVWRFNHMPDNKKAPSTGA
ncbi:50S ribosomal protein L11 methyltransferase [uncultured Cohaesibacter sp.]|uniref:class I SAM-dependent methyltransferase n=1 Tax=uncultured Cohaesibacter sp. TaxID=1002546 RepID=UPI0029C71BF5|nr:50S ribosomal protein L11 methyltransferase [uncultured Cohaesibacter sp.]